ncbi:MAG: GPP34 family phosphoprotein [Streptomyces sp.]|nr:GPP34 family phosphoprotein [Streptomyces sp.]NUP36293.1 GPP34 family phosphoprotein [Streptomyces sp.]
MIDDLPCLMYLLAYDETAEGPYDRPRTRLLLRAAALVDLAQRGRLREDDGTVTVLGTQPTGAPALDGMLHDAAGGHGWKHLVRTHRKRTLTEVEDHLAAAGVLTVKEPRTPLGTRRVTLTDRAVPAALHARMSVALRGSEPVPSLPAADTALLALAAAGGVPSVVSRQDRKTYRARINACTTALAALAPGLEKAVHDLPTTMIAAQGGMGGN